MKPILEVVPVSTQLKENKGLSLHIGLNAVSPAHYKNWSGELQACENDAKNMQQMALSAGCETHILLTEEATEKQVRKHLLEAAEVLVAGDFFFLTYSGHGGQTLDKNGDEKDLQDETWCLFDRQLLDDEIYMYLGRFKAGVRIFVLSDSCHSGTVLKQHGMEENLLTNLKDINGESFSIKAMSPEHAKEVYMENQETYDDVQKNQVLKKARLNVKASAILISGCQDNQQSLDGTFSGVFTGAVLFTWKNGDFSGNYHDFYEAVKNNIDPAYNQTPNFFMVGPREPGFESQTPMTV